ncbi:MAG: xylan 1,4-beta-xylosidase [Sporichthyaceae bacterium]
MTADATRGRAAKSDFEERIGRRTGGGERDSALPPPAGLRAVAGRGHVTLDWEPVEGAVGYLVHRAESPDGPFEPVDHGGNDVLAVPHPPYVDTSGVRGAEYWYAVAALPEVTRTGELSAPVASTAAAEGEAAVRLTVDAGHVIGPLHRPWRPMIGSEHLSFMLETAEVGGRSIGEELTEALQRMHDELGVETVRAHAILCDDLGVYREVDGQPVHDFSGIDRVYDALLATGLRPVVELSYMPRDLASDPARTVFAYEGIISPPKDWDRWADLVTDLTAHLVDRYGIDEVRDRWSFEVWNEANLDVFWSGTLQEYLRLYDVTVAAVRKVDERLVVGGPSSAAAQWVETLVEHAEETGSPVDFVSTHTYGSPPLDLRPILTRHGRDEVRIWWTEWGPGSQHFHHVGDSVFAATFLLEGMVSSMGRIEALSHWVASDHFEELGRPTKLGHGGFGLLTVGNLRKPRWWSLALLERLGDDRVAVTAEGDGGGGLVKAVAAKDGDEVGVVVWCSSLDQSRIPSDELLARDVTLRVAGLAGGRWTVEHHRVDESHSNVFAAWRDLGGADRDWPAGDDWDRLRDADGLAELEPSRTVEVGSLGVAELAFDIPLPGISGISLRRA